jgi:predicted enzyme related to lactoylglutathione lyase
MLKSLQISGVTIGIPVPDPDAATEWYARLLGHGPEYVPVPGVSEFELYSGVWLQIMRPEKENQGGCMLRLGVDDIEAQRELIVGDGIEVTPIDEVEGVVKYCDFDDPYGNRLTLVEVIAE